MSLPLYYLIQRQSLPLKQKIILTKKRIENWYETYNGDVYVSLSGKDSTALLHIVRSLYPEVPAVTVNTGLEHPENIKFIKENIKNVVWLKPDLTFKQVIDEYGFPAISKMTARKIYTLQNPTEKNKLTSNLYRTGINSEGKYHSRSQLAQKWLYLIDNEFGYKFSHKCCDIMKKIPIKKFEKEAGMKGFVGTMASESNARQRTYLQTGCNNFGENGYSKPISFWLEQDILEYIYTNKIEISAAYGSVEKNDDGIYSTTGESRTGCLFCLFGCHLEKQPNRIQRLKEEYPSIYDYCIRDKTSDKDGLGMGKLMSFLNIPFE